MGLSGPFFFILKLETQPSTAPPHPSHRGAPARPWPEPSAGPRGGPWPRYWRHACFFLFSASVQVLAVVFRLSINQRAFLSTFRPESHVEDGAL